MERLDLCLARAWMAGLSTWAVEILLICVQLSAESSNHLLLTFCVIHTQSVNNDLIRDVDLDLLLTIVLYVLQRCPLMDSLSFMLVVFWDNRFQWLTVISFLLKCHLRLFCVVIFRSDQEESIQSCGSSIFLYKCWRSLCICWHGSIWCYRRSVCLLCMYSVHIFEFHTS